MRTSADRPSKYSATERSPCPRCGGKRTQVSSKWWGYDKNGEDVKLNKGWGCWCAKCGFGDGAQFQPQIFDNEKSATIAWNLVAATTTKEEASIGNKYAPVDRLDEYRRLK